MTWAARAVAGFFAGGLLTLVAHPLSRPLLLSAAEHISASTLERCFDDRTTQPSPPHDLEGASLWLQLASEQSVRRIELRTAELSTLLGIAQRAAQVDPRNAFWFQEQAVLLSASGRPQEAYAAWERASRCETWDDYQTRRLLDTRARLARVVGAREAWQLAYVYTERSAAPALEIERYGRLLLGQHGLSKPGDLQVRYITLLNGELVRLRARSVATGLLGANLVELAAYPSDLVKTPGPKRLLVAQSKFLSDLPATGIPDAANHARVAFAKNESWRALTLAQDPRALLDSLSAASVLSGSVIGACAFAALIGLITWTVGSQVSGHVKPGSRLSLSFVIPFATALAVMCTWLTHDLWAGLVGALAGSFLYVGPANGRRAQPEDLGPLFSLLMTIIATLCGVSLGAFAIARTAAAEALLPYLGIPIDFYTTPLLLGMACIFFSLALTAVPVWALVQRLGTPHVFGLALRKLGAHLAFGSLAIGIVLGPVAVYADARIDQTLFELVGNEPVYYILHT